MSAPKTQSVNLVDLITTFVKNRVTKPEAVVVKNLQGQSIQIVEVKVDPTDAGRIIGKGGEVIRALGTVVATISKGRTRVNLVGLPQRPEKSS